MIFPDHLSKLQSRWVGHRMKPPSFCTQPWLQGANTAHCLAWEAGRWITRMGRQRGEKEGGVLRRRTKLHRPPMLRPPGAEGGRRGKGSRRRHFGCSSQTEAVSLSSLRDRERQRQSRMLCGTPWAWGAWSSFWDWGIPAAFTMHQSLTQQRSSDMSLPDSMGKSSRPSSWRQQGVSVLPSEWQAPGRPKSQRPGSRARGSMRPSFWVVDQSPRGAAGLRWGRLAGIGAPSLRPSIPALECGCVRVSTDL
jgi:hypothetical protein